MRRMRPLHQASAVIVEPREGGAQRCDEAEPIGPITGFHYWRTTEGFSNRSPLLWSGRYIEGSVGR